VLELCALRRRPDAMLAACRAADHVEFVVVAPATPGIVLPEFLAGEQLVRLNLVQGRDCPEVMLDERGIQVTLTFRGRRHECVLPWEAVKAGVLAPPKKKVRRFGVVEGGAGGKAPAPAEPAAATPTPAPAPAPTPVPVPAPASTASPAEPPPPPPRPRVPFGVILGGKSDPKD
jgi:hypothetical protein